MTSISLQDLTIPLIKEDLLTELHVDISIISKQVTGIISDSRKIQKNNLFVALAGEHVDGHRYVSDAIHQGAIAVVIDSTRKEEFKNLVEQHRQLVAFYTTKNSNKALAALSSAFFVHPGSHLRMIGVTGTNGKTTVTHLIEQLLLSHNRSVGLIGTLGHKSVAKNQPTTDNSDKARYQSTSYTTPMAPELQAILHTMQVQDQNEFVVMEVSSHALEQHRVYGCDFEIAVLTNLTQDHLDYHKTMEQYWQAKALLFKGLSQDPANAHPRVAVINLDSDYAEDFKKACPANIKQISYSIFNPSAQVSIRNPQYSIAGSEFTLVTPCGENPVALKLGGQFSVYNALAALSVGLALNIPVKSCITAIESVTGIRGRFELVSKKPYVLVDYAHTPDGLENVLQAARLVTPKTGRLIVVFGCGGDRDATKRPKMGHIAESLADILFITSDNPRSEDPQQIITDVISGIERFNATQMFVETDRKQAIHQAVDMANDEDIIVIAGKGHEDYQILADKTIHFDDREIVQSYLKSLSGCS